MPAAGEQTVVVQTSYGLVPIGWVQSALRILDEAPNQRQGAPQAWISFDEQVAEGAKDLRPGDEIVVLTWLHLSPRGFPIRPESSCVGMRDSLDAYEAVVGLNVGRCWPRLLGCVGNRRG